MWSKLKLRLFGYGSSVAFGTVADTATHLQRLLDAPSDAFLIIELAEDRGSFVQFTAGPNEIQIDYPLLYPEQVAREEAFRRVYAAAGLSPYETRVSDEDRFLDCDLPRDAVAAAIVVDRILTSVFGVTRSTELRFVGDGLAPVESP
jgi:hypothetical protein